MKLQILLFAGMRQRLGQDQIQIEVDQSKMRAEQLLESIQQQYPELADTLPHCRLAVQHSFVDGSEVLDIDEDQELALIPPVSGGHDGPQPTTFRSKLLETPLSLADAIAEVEHPGAGGLTTFTGNVRRQSRGKSVSYLVYEAYPEMALKAMDAIIKQVEKNIPGTKVALHHRIGHLEIGESAVVIAASAPHRAEAFESCRAVIEALKQDVPIWKKEVDEQGGEWIGQGP